LEDDMSDRAERVLFVHAHPDDETLSTGATIATLVRGGASVGVLTCTRGELGEVIPEELAGLSGDSLGAHRLSELDGALATLGVTEHRILGAQGARWAGREPRRYRDSGMTWGSTGAIPLSPLDPESLAAADPGEVAADIAAVILAFDPDVVVSYAADGGYGHPDHVRAHDATRTAAEVLRVPFYVIDSEGGPRGPITVDPAPVFDTVRAALAHHRTQVRLTADTYSLSSGAPRPIARKETFTRISPHSEPEPAPSAASRVGSAALALLLGAFAGATLTLAHQATVTIAGVPVPWGVGAALAITAALVVGLRLLFPSRIPAVCAAVGLLGLSAILAVQSLGGSVIVPANAVGYAWTFGPVAICLIALAWPRFARPAARAADGTIEVSVPKGPAT
jgi:N-acetyl-1-D-myo-inositol-2-amino-2-deoxy-alpha-D-glucopyranoside deacetylase